MGVVHLSGGEWVVAGVLWVIGPILGYYLSENDRRTLGRTPWGLPSLVWALFWLLSLLVGLVLYLIAHTSEVRRVQHGSPAAYPGGRGAPPPGPGTRPVSAAEQFPAYPRPANVAPERPDPGPPAWDSSPPAWHPDPSGRYQYRWWNGNEWTAQVATDGQYLIDTNPDQRIGPYH